MALVHGTRVGAYEIRSLLGSGGMGEVYLAEDVRLRRQVALKRLVGISPDASPFSDRLLNEARAAASLNHPNIAAIHDVFEADGSAFIVMEYAPGETLAAVVRRGAVPTERLLEIGVQLADALVAAHGVGILHRDLKPSNIHLTPAGTIKVLDFGVARIARDELQGTGEERTRTAVREPVVGTPGYIAPEQLAGLPFDGRADIYSAGVVLFQLATGRPPFEGEDPLDRMLSAIGKPAPKASDVNPGVPPPVSDVIACALATKPRDRFQTAGEFKSAVEGAAATVRHLPTWDAPTGAVVPPSVTAVPHARSKVHWLPVGLLVALALAAGGFLAKWRATSEPAAESPRAAVSGRATVIAVLPPENRTGDRPVDDWPALIQSVLASELTGRPDLAVMDVLGLSDLLDEPPKGDRRTLDALRRARVTLAVGGELLAAEGGYEVLARVVDTETGESRFTARAKAPNEQALPRASRELATQVLSFLQVRVLQLADSELTPWISYREQNIEALKAFAIGNQYVYSRQHDDSERAMRRAIELDPAFIAPKLWLIPRLQRTDRREEAEAMYASLLELESKASPFEQALISYVGARLRNDYAAMMRGLEVAMRYSPGNNILLVTWANLRISSGDCEGPRTALQPAVDVGWRYPPLYPLWAWCAFETGHPGDAAAGIDRALELKATAEDPDISALLEAIALAIGDERRAATCRAIYETRRQQEGRTGTSSNVTGVYTRFGTQCLRTGAFAQAAALFAKAIAAEPTVAAHHDHLGEAFEGLGDLERARRAYEKAIGLDRGLTHARDRLQRLAAGARPKGDER